MGACLQHKVTPSFIFPQLFSRIKPLHSVQKQSSIPGLTQRQESTMNVLLIDLINHGLLVCVVVVPFVRYHGLPTLFQFTGDQHMVMTQR